MEGGIDSHVEWYTWKVTTAAGKLETVLQFVECDKTIWSHPRMYEFVHI